MQHKGLRIVVILYLIVQCSVACKQCWRNKGEANEAWEPQSDKLAEFRSKLNRSVTVKQRGEDFILSQAISAPTLEYSIGDIFRAECQKNSPGLTLQWYQSIPGTNESLGIYPPCDSDTCLLQMTLQLFDDGTILTCAVIAWLNGTRRVKNSARVVTLKLKKYNMNIFDTTSTEEPYIVDIGTPGVVFSCENGTPIDTIGIYGQSFKTYNQSVVKLSDENLHNGTRVFCVRYVNLLHKGFTRETFNYKLFITMASETTSYSTTTLIGVAGGTLAVLGILTTFIVMKWKHHQASEPDENLHYADLDVPQSRTVQFRNRRNDLPYAEVIGVLAPKTNS